MSALLIQLDDKEFKQILAEAYKDGYIRAVAEVQSATQSDWLSEAETTKALHITASTLAKYRHERRIAYRGKRGALEYSRADVEKIINDRQINRV